MMFLKPQFWSKKISLFAVFLWPISLIYRLSYYLKTVFTREVKFKIPIICIGNIYLGGTGKTPLSILIAEELKKTGKIPAIIKKDYSNHFDENSLIKTKTKSLYLGENRKIALDKAINDNCNVAILDDGFQDFSIKKDLNILCFNSKQLIGNGMVIPAGPLREGINSIKRADIIIINGQKNCKFEKKLFKKFKNLEIFYTKYIPININEFKKKKLFAFAGIGNPNNFFDILIEENLYIQKKTSFPDHYNFKEKDIKDIINYSQKNNLQPVTTEKDYHRIKNLGFKNIKYLKVRLSIFNNDKFFKKINNYL